MEKNFKWQKVESHTSSSLSQASDLASWKPIHGFSSLRLLSGLLLLPFQKHILILHLQSYLASLTIDVITWKYHIPGRMYFSHACLCATSSDASLRLLSSPLRQRHCRSFSSHWAVTQPSLCLRPHAEAQLEMTCSLEQQWHLPLHCWATAWAPRGCDLAAPFPG